MSVFGYAVSANREPVEVYTVALRTLIYLEEAVAAIDGIPLHDRNSVFGGSTIGIAQLVTMMDKLVGRNPHGQYVICRPLVEHVLGRLVIGIGHIVAPAMEHVVRHNPVLQLLHSIGFSRLNALRLPVVVRLAEKREAVLAVLGSIGIRVTGNVCHVVAAFVHIVVHVGNLAGLIHRLIDFVAHLAQRIKQSAGLQSFGKHQVALALLVEDVLDIAGTGLIFGSNDLMQFMHDAVDNWNVAIGRVHSTHLVQVQGVVLAFADCQLMIIYSRQRELCILFSISKCGDESRCISLLFGITAVDDRVEHDHLSHRVALGTVCKCVPRGFAYQALFHQVFQVFVNRLVGEGEACVVTTRRQELVNGRLTPFTHRYQLREFHILRVVLVCLKITGNSIFFKHITRGGVDILRA